jgi:hypothetical protein
MSEIKETIAILKARWPEVVLIIGLHVLTMLVNKLHLWLTGIGSFLGLINLSCMLVLLVIIVLLTVAFQRTVYIEGRKRQTPLNLLLIGKHFLWRLIGFELLYFPIWFVLAWIIFLVINRITPIDTSFLETAKTVPFVYYLCFAIAALILIKPLLLVFPILIVRDCRLLESFKLLKHFRLFDAKGLVILFLASTALTVMWVFLPSIESEMAITQLILRVLLSVVQSFMGLMVAVMAVRFVGSLELSYNGIPNR